MQTTEHLIFEDSRGYPVGHIPLERPAADRWQRRMDAAAAVALGAGVSLVCGCLVVHLVPARTSCALLALALLAAAVLLVNRTGRR